MTDHLTPPPKSKRMRVVWGALLLALAVFLWRYLLPPLVEVVHPQRGPAVQAVYATGTVESSVMLPIAARTTGRLSRLLADEGDEVAQGQLLAELESDEMQGNLNAAQARESFTRAEFERNDDLFRRGAVSRQAFERASSEWEMAKGAVEAARAHRGYLALVAPAAGIVIRRDGEQGQMIPSNQPVFWLSAASPLRISAEVDEEDIAQVRVDQAVVVRADAFPNRVFQARVKSITPKGDPVARSYRVRIELTEQTPLQIGMTAETNIVVQERDDALLVPASALIDGKLLRVVNSTLETVNVNIGIRGKEQLEVLEGVDPDDLIVLKPTSSLRASQRVRAHVSDPSAEK